MYNKVPEKMKNIDNTIHLYHTGYSLMKQNMSSRIPHRHAIALRPTELRWACGGNQYPDKHGLLPEPSGRRHKPINCAGCDQIRAAGVLYCQQII